MVWCRGLWLLWHAQAPGQHVADGEG
jgi:hypothetical protein